MADAWIYIDPDEPDLTGEFARELAELGFSPRQISANGRLAPHADGPLAPARRATASVPDSSCNEGGDRRWACR